MTLSKEKAQEIIKELRKLATPFGGSLGPATAPAPGGSASAAGGGNSNSPIGKMQTALVGLAQDVTSQLNLQKLTGPNPERQEAAGRDSFGDFFAKHYLRNSDVPSVEFNPDPSKTEMADKDPRAASKLSWVMDTMRRIGGAHAEGFADGNWGPRTNAALSNAYALASGLLKLADNFKLPIKSYSESNLAKLAPAIREDNSLTPEEKNDVAPIVAEHLKMIRRLYAEVKQGILEKPQYRAYIEGDKPYVQYDNKNLSAQQLSSLQQIFPEGFSIPINDKGSTAKIGVDDLVSLDTLNKWIAQYPDAKLNPSNILASVSKQIQPTRST